MSRISRRTAALAGIAVAPFWIGIVVVLTLLQLDFLRSLGWSLTTAQEVPYPSALARGDLGVLQMVNFAVTAALIATFATGFRREFRHRVSGAIATAGFALVAVGMLLNVAPTDLPGEPTTLSGTLHIVGFLVTIASMAVAYAASGLALRGNPAWHGWRLLGWTPALLVVIFLAAPLLPGDVGFCLFLAVAVGWFSVTGARLLAVDRAAGVERVARPLPDATAPGLL